MYILPRYYHEEGVWRAIATSPVFEKMTLTVIAFNAFWTRLCITYYTTIYYAILYYNVTYYTITETTIL